MLEELLPHRRADAAGVQAEPLAIVLLQLLHLARQRAALEAVHRAIFAVDRFRLLWPMAASNSFKRHSARGATRA